MSSLHVVHLEKNIVVSIGVVDAAGSVELGFGLSEWKVERVLRVQFMIKGVRISLEAYWKVNDQERKRNA